MKKKKSIIKKKVVKKVPYSTSKQIKVYDKPGKSRVVKKVFNNIHVASRGEKTISYFLNKMKIRYKKEVKFPWLLGINNGEMRLDFYLPDHNTAIEFDGIYHDTSTYQKMNDSKKNSLLKSKGIKILRIHYKDYWKIEEILKKTFGKKKKK